MYKALIVDDEQWIINNLVRSIDWHNFFMEVVSTATDGKEAYHLAKEIKPDIIITDLRMPGMHGLEFIKRYKDIDPEVLIIVLSGYDIFSYAQQALRLNVFDYLLKPINKNSVEKVLLRAISLLNEKKANSEICKDFNEIINKRQDNEYIMEIVDYINDYYQQDITLTSIAEKFFMNPSYLSDLFSKKLGVTFSNYLTNIRIEKATQFLIYTDYTLETIAEKTGFNNYRKFIRAFKRIHSITPTEYRNKNRKEYISK